MTTETRRLEERLVTGHTGRMLLTLAFGWTTIQVGRQILPPLLPTIIDDLGISPADAGVALTVMWGLYALVHYPAGRLADRLSRKTVLVGGVALVGTGAAALTVSRTYPLFVLSTSVVGVGAGLYFVSSRARLADLFVERRGQAFGLQLMAGPLGSALAAGLAVAVLATATWRLAFVPVVLATGVVALGLHRWGTESYVVGPVDLGLGRTVRRVFATGNRRWLVVGYSMFALAWQGAISFLPTFLQAEKGFSPTLASAGFALLFVAGAAGMPLAGRLADRVGSLPVATGALLLAGTGLASVVATGSPVGVAVSVALFGVGLMGFPPVMQAFLMDQFPGGSMAGDFGAFKTVYTVVGSLGPAYVGLVVEGWSFTTAYLSLLVSIAGAAVIVLLLARRG